MNRRPMLCNVETLAAEIQTLASGVNLLCALEHCDASGLIADSAAEIELLAGRIRRLVGPPPGERKP